MALTWAGVITILFLAAACVRGYRRGLIKELVSLVCVFLSMAIVWFINPYVNEFIRENTSIYEKVQESCREFVGEEYSTWTGSGESQTEFINEMNLPELLRNGLVQNNNSDSYQYLAVTTFSDYIAQYLARMAVNGISFLISLLMSTIMVRSITWIIVIWIIFLALTIVCNTKAGEAALQIIKKDCILSFIYDRDILIRIFMSIFY